VASRPCLQQPQQQQDQSQQGHWQPPGKSGLFSHRAVQQNVEPESVLLPHGCWPTWPHMHAQCCCCCCCCQPTWPHMQAPEVCCCQRLPCLPAAASKAQQQQLARWAPAANLGSIARLLAASALW
jgi:hypothetical protein